VVEHHLAHRFDYTSTTLLRTFPDGLDVEVISVDALVEANACAATQSEREHVTPFVQRNPQRFNLGAYVGERDLQDERWTVDTQDDLTFLTTALEGVSDPECATWLEILEHVGVRFRQPPASPELHVYRGSPVGSPPALDPARRTWAVHIDERDAGTIGVDVADGGIGTIRANVCADVDRVGLLTALERRLSADLQVVDLIGSTPEWAHAFVGAGFDAGVDGTYRRSRLTR